MAGRPPDRGGVDRTDLPPPATGRERSRVGGLHAKPREPWTRAHGLQVLEILLALMAVGLGFDKAPSEPTTVIHVEYTETTNNYPLGMGRSRGCVGVP